MLIWYKMMHKFSYEHNIKYKRSKIKALHPKIIGNNLRMAQVMQWPPAIRNYMRKVRLKYQHVIAIFPLLTASLNTKN